jgi:signal transduction histidine kinase
VRIDAQGTVKIYTEADGLAHNSVEDIYEDAQGVVWLATAGGISRWDGQRFENFRVEEGLPVNHVHRICPADRGHLLFATDAGVVRWDGQIFQTVHVAEIGAVNAITPSRAGGFWLGTTQGIAHYTPGTVPPQVRVQQLLADRAYTADEDIQFSSTCRQIICEYKGISFRTAPGAMLYRCRLAGHDDQWSTPTREMRVFYRDLPPGDYTFQVKAIDRDLNESEPAQLAFTITHSADEERISELEQHVKQRTAELERANAQLVEASHNKSQFLRHMSHDLRSPMNAILGYTRLLKRTTADRLSTREQHNLQNIETSSNNQLRLINEILDLSRIEAGRVELHIQKVEVAQLAGECADALESIVQSGVELRRELETVEPIQTDPDRLRQVITNLLGNATKFTTQGSITLSVRPTDEGVEISVMDTGVGIPPADLPHIFDEFRQVEREGAEGQGTGLGLTIVKKTVELLGGEIKAQSDMGRGTRFILTIGKHQS